VNNNNSALHDADCSDADENVVVQQIPTQIKSQQSWIPNDTATITSTNNSFTLPAGGSVVFTLYDTATCTGNVKYTETLVPQGGALTEELSTSNTGGATGFKITTGYADINPASKGPFSWKVVYNPPAGAFLGKQSSCASATSTESFTINYHNDPGPGTDLP
jgi:hypothetical protein